MGAHNALTYRVNCLAFINMPVMTTFHEQLDHFIMAVLSSLAQRSEPILEYEELDCYSYTTVAILSTLSLRRGSASLLRRSSAISLLPLEAASIRAVHSFWSKRSCKLQLSYVYCYYILKQVMRHQNKQLFHGLVKLQKRTRVQSISED